MLHVQKEAIDAHATPAPRQRLVVVGNGMSPGRALEKLFEAAPEAYKVTIFNAEPRVNYDRIMLSPVLSGEKSFEEIVIHGDGWYVKHGVTLYKGHRIVAIDREARTVTSDRSVVEPYDRLIIATGSTPIVIPVPGHKLAGVLTYRDLDDVNAMLLAARSGGRAVVIGGGLLGLEAAVGLREQGMDVSVVHLMPTLLERQLDPPAGFLLARAIEARGVKVFTKANTKEILGTDHALGPSRVRAVVLDNGTELPADLVVMAVGIRPSAAIAREAGLAVNRGIVVGADMRTSDPDIFALGECAEALGQCFGLVAPLYDMANVVAQRLAGDETAAFNPVATATKLKVTGINLFSAGDFSDGDDREEIVLRDAARGVYRRLVIKENRLTGIVLYGDVSHGAWLFDLLKKGADVAGLRETLMFGPNAAGGAPPDPTAAVAALPDDAEICGCNGVCKGKIVETIKAKNLTSLDGVRAHTKASASCGSCTGLVEQVIKLTLGGTYAPAAVAPMCGCTPFGHDDVRRLVVAKGLKSIPAVMQALEWDLVRLRQMPPGAQLLSPLRLARRIRGRRAIALRQRTRPRQHPARRDLFGRAAHVGRRDQREGTSGHRRRRQQIRHTDRQGDRRTAHRSARRAQGAAPRDFGRSQRGRARVGCRLRQGAAHGEDLRRFRLVPVRHQDSTGLGIKLEKFLWGSWTPAKVKLAVSGCPRNCAEATCKDVGMICVDSGYDIVFAGAAGLDIQGTQALCHTSCEEETIEIVAALIQLYREQGRYLERIYKWTKRVGADSIKAQVVDDKDRRRALHGRFVASQRLAQVDPWSERAAGKDAHEFAPIADLPFLHAAE